MKKSKEQVELYKSNIRKLMVVRHDMPVREMRDRLEKTGLKLDTGYINRLRNKVLAERSKRADRKTLSSALAAFEDTLAETSRIAWQIALDPQAKKRDRIAALKEVREAQKDVFDKLFDAGVFDRKLGAVDVDHKHTHRLAPELAAPILNAFKNYGIINTTKIIETEQLPVDTGTSATGNQ